VAAKVEGRSTMLTAEDFAILDDKYVRKDDCNDRHVAQEKEITEIIVQQTKMSTQIIWNNGIKTQNRHQNLLYAH
jgi:hypothetical protein